MLKNKKLLENLANYCIDKSIKFGATECEVNISNFISDVSKVAVSKERKRSERASK